MVSPQGKPRASEFVFARLRYESSRLGEWLDTIGDGIGMAAFLAGTTLHAMRGDPEMGLVGGVGIAAWLLVQALQTAGAMVVGEGEWSVASLERFATSDPSGISARPSCRLTALS